MGKHMCDTRETILEYLRTQGIPMTVRRISQDLELTRISTYQELEKLVKEQELSRIVPISTNPDYDDDEKYYTIKSQPQDASSPSNTSTEASAIESLNQRFATLDYGLKESIKQISAENRTLKQQLKSIYSNILTLMGIFVAIFALIITNVSAVASIIDPLASPTNNLLSVLILNVPLVFSIGFLLLFTRIFLCRLLSTDSKYSNDGILG